MTKSIVITYQEGDESFLMTFFKRFGIQTNAFKNVSTDNVNVPQDVADDMDMESVQDLGKRLNKEHEELGFLPPRQNIDLSQLRGGFKNKMTNEEIDFLTKSWRNEWEQDLNNLPI